MIRKYLSWSLLSLLLAAGGAAAELKIAVLDVQRALAESEEAKQFMEALQSDLQAEQTEMNELRQEIVSLQEQLQKDAEVMSPSEQRKRQKEIEDKRIDLQFLGNKLEKEVQDRQGELLQQMAPKIDAVLKDLIEEESYDLILQPNRAASFLERTLLYADSDHDITRKVTEKLNEKLQASR